MIFSVWLGNIDVNNRDHLVGRPTRARGEVDLSDIFSMVGSHQEAWLWRLRD